MQNIWTKTIASMATSGVMNQHVSIETNKLYELPKAVGNETVFEGIIGNSHLLLNVFDHIMQVAPSDTSVLILGESGTGKERIADSIHNLSPRKKKICW